MPADVIVPLLLFAAFVITARWLAHRARKRDARDRERDEPGHDDLAEAAA